MHKGFQAQKYLKPLLNERQQLLYQEHRRNLQLEQPRRVVVQQARRAPLGLCSWGEGRRVP